MNCDIDIKVPSMNCDIDIKVPLFTKNETFENNEAADMYEPLWAKNTLKYIPTPPNPQPIIKPTRDTSIHAARILKKGDRFDSKELCMYEIGYKALLDGYQFKTRKSDTTRYDVICRNDDCNWKIISSKCKGSSKWELGTVHDHHTCPKTQIELTNDGTVTNIETDDEDHFKMVFIALGVVIPNYLPDVKPPHMDKQPSGRPKSTERIRSQGEEPVIVRSERKEHILEEAHSKQMTTYRNQCRNLSMLST
ncbi:transposase, MuDR, MULE transposase domain protein [Tanacetum coccineum]